MKQKEAHDIQFLKELQKQMQEENENGEGKASPNLWVVMDSKIEPCWEGIADQWLIHSPRNLEDYPMTKETFSRLIESHNLDGDNLSLLDTVESLEGSNIMNTSALDWFQKHFDEDAYLVPLKEVSFIVPDAVFFTKEEAVYHIENDRNHYSSKAHVQAMPTCKTPQVERLLNMLLTFDFENISE